VFGVIFYVLLYRYNSIVTNCPCCCVLSTLYTPRELIDWGFDCPNSWWQKWVRAPVSIKCSAPFVGVTRRPSFLVAWRGFTQALPGFFVLPSACWAVGFRFLVSVDCCYVAWHYGRLGSTIWLLSNCVKCARREDKIAVGLYDRCSRDWQTTWRATQWLRPVARA
jgi:hypothetical protein